jgi:hypothetical protein
MPALLRFLATLNLAAWLGGAIFLTFAAGPAFFSPEMLAVMDRYCAGRAAQIVLARYFNFQLVCAGIAVVQLLVGWFYAGKAPGRWQAGLLAALVGLSLLGGFWMQPKLKQLHTVMYAATTPQPEKDAAKRTFGMWHGISQSANLLLTFGVIGYFWIHLNGTQRSRRLGLSAI